MKRISLVSLARTPVPRSIRFQAIAWTIGRRQHLSNGWVYAGFPEITFVNHDARFTGVCEGIANSSFPLMAGAPRRALGMLMRNMSLLSLLDAYEKFAIGTDVVMASAFSDKSDDFCLNALRESKVLERIGKFRRPAVSNSRVRYCVGIASRNSRTQE
ncbi:MAG: hypothetical protein ABI866_04190, partial [Dokdonella sp.]